MNIKIPDFSGENFLVEFEFGDRFVCVGANGSGKTRLGAYIEEQVYRTLIDGGNNSDHNVRIKEQRIEGCEKFIEQTNERIAKFQELSEEQLCEMAQKQREAEFKLPDGKVVNCSDYVDYLITEENDNYCYFEGCDFGGVEVKGFESLKQGFINTPQGHINLSLAHYNEFSGLSGELVKKTLTRRELHRIAQHKGIIAQCEKELLEFKKAQQESENTKETLGIQYCLRISAHRALVVADRTTPSDHDVTKNQLLFGSQHDPTLEPAGKLMNRNRGQSIKQTKWANKPVEGLQSDFDMLMASLVSEDAHASVSDRLLRKSGIEESYSNTKLDRIIEVWNELLPHREIVRNGFSIEIKPPNGDLYPLSKCSEGERSLFYILGQALQAMQNSVIIIDEPEIHLNRSILNKFIDRIENERQDCVIFYITHDVDFACSRVDAKKIMIHSYQHENTWDLSFLDREVPIPEEILVAVLGSRNPVLFVEGTDSSLDVVYEGVYPQFTRYSVGCCEAVKSTVKSLSSSPLSGHIKAFGVIDRDDLDAEAVIKEESKGVFVSRFAIIENLFLQPEVAAYIYNLVKGESMDINEYNANIIGWVKSNDDWLAKSMRKRVINHISKAVDSVANKVCLVQEGVQKSIEQIDVSEIISLEKGKWEDAIGKGDIQEILSQCRGKHVLPQFVNYLGLANRTVFVQRIRNIRDEAFFELLRKYLPEID